MNSGKRKSREEVVARPSKVFSTLVVRTECGQVGRAAQCGLEHLVHRHRRGHLTHRRRRPQAHAHRAIQTARRPALGGRDGRCTHTQSELNDLSFDMSLCLLRVPVLYCIVQYLQISYEYVQDVPPGAQPESTNASVLTAIKARKFAYRIWLGLVRWAARLPAVHCAGAPTWSFECFGASSSLWATCLIYS